MKIVVLGSGAMGCVYGGKLAEAGYEVTLVDIWKEHIDAIKQNGLHIEGVGGERKITSVNAVTSPSEAGKADLVIVFVKATMTEEAVVGAKDIFQENSIVLTLQNGLGNIEAIGRHVNPNQIMAGAWSHSLRAWESPACRRGLYRFGRNIRSPNEASRGVGSPFPSGRV